MAESKRLVRSVSAIFGALGWVLVLCGHPPAARATPLTLRWQAPPGCPVHAQVFRAILDLLPADSSAETNETVGLAAKLAADSAGFGVLLRIETGGGTVSERLLHGGSCESVTRAVVLIAALAVDAVYVAERVSQRADRRIEPSPSVPARAHEIVAPRPRVSLGARAAVALGVLPKLTPGAGFMAGVQVGRVSVDGQATFYLPRRAAVERSEGPAVDLSLATGALRGCLAALRTRQLLLGVCTGVELGVMKGKGVQLTHPRTARGLFAAALVGATARHSADSGMFAELTLDGLVGWQQTTFVIDDLGTVFQSSRLMGRLAVAVGWTFL